MDDESRNNPFEMLGIEPRYELDRARVEREYLQRLARSHPDAGGQSGGVDAAALNRARATLLDDESRAIALLALLGGPDASAHKGLPDGFLMEIMERRQQIELQIQDGGENARENWEQWARRERSEHRDGVGELFAALPERPDPEALRAIRVRLNAWRYIERLIEQLDPEYDPARADFR